jgi:hypothetical protein
MAINDSAVKYVAKFIWGKKFRKENGGESNRRIQNYSEF